MREHRAPGVVLREHELEVPLDHDAPDGPRITVFAREVAADDGLDRPLLLFLQGGPGMEAPRLTRRPHSPGWLDRALEDFRVLMLDQRGTGRSTPVGRLDGMTAAAQAGYLACFRADAIVRDAEAFRAHLGSPPWRVLGQSFGGFCAVTYLSFAPEGLCEVIITGGLPPLGSRLDEVYPETYRRLAVLVERHFARYPEDRDRLEALAARCAAEDLRLPSGDRLTARRLRQLGSELGMSDGSEHLHHLLELPPHSPAFRHDVEVATSFARNPIYALLQEPCWADGGATRWAAARTLPEDTLLTAEHVFPWMWEDHGALAPLRGAAELLAEREWPRLSDPSVLAGNEVPCAAAIYADDPYVVRVFSEETAGRIRGLRPWLTNEYLHNGLRADGPRVLGHLLDLVRGRA